LNIGFSAVKKACDVNYEYPARYQRDESEKKFPKMAREQAHIFYCRF